MAKSFKLRIPSFHCCRSKDISVVPTDPPPLPSKTHHSSLTRHVSSAFRTAACACRSTSTNSDEDEPRSSPRLPRDGEKYTQHVAAMAVPGCYGGVLSPPPSPLPPPPLVEKKKRRYKKKKATLRLRVSTSSAESGLFSSESFDEIDDEETETLVSSSKSISTDDDSSSEFNPHLETIRENPYKSSSKKQKKKKKKKKIRRSKQRKIKTSPSPETESPARLSVFQRLIPCTVDGKIRESFAVVKKSEDPYEDFKRSMMEMIMEKQMFDEKDLEQLLHCLLSLNDREHHGVIVEAFSEIWQSLFCRRSASRTSF